MKETALLLAGNVVGLIVGYLFAAAGWEDADG